MGNMKKKRNYAATVRDKNIIGLYSKCRELTDLLADLVKITLLTDTTVLHISTIGKLFDIILVIWHSVAKNTPII